MCKILAYTTILTYKLFLCELNNQRVCTPCGQLAGKQPAQENRIQYGFQLLHLFITNMNIYSAAGSITSRLLRYLWRLGGRTSPSPSTKTPLRKYRRRKRAGKCQWSIELGVCWFLLVWRVYITNRAEQTTGHAPDASLSARTGVRSSAKSHNGIKLGACV